MDFETIRNMRDEEEKVNAVYQIFNEDTRLNDSKAARVEFLTTVRYIEKYLKPGDKILDIGAGAGEYSIYFAKQGYEITAVELTTVNIEAFQRKLQPDMNITLLQGNALDLSAFADEAFDIVLLFGPLYHLEKPEDRQRCLHEAIRVCRPEGVLFFSFISNDMVILTELGYQKDFFKQNTYDHETFKVEDFPFVFFTVDQARGMLKEAGIHIKHEVASDGVSELMGDKINAMDEESYEQYLKYHYYCCEKPEMLGRSNHLLFVGAR